MQLIFYTEHTRSSFAIFPVYRYPIPSIARWYTWYGHHTVNCPQGCHLSRDHHKFFYPLAPSAFSTSLHRDFPTPPLAPVRPLVIIKKADKHHNYTIHLASWSFSSRYLMQRPNSPPPEPTLCYNICQAKGQSEEDKMKEPAEASCDRCTHPTNWTPTAHPAKKVNIKIRTSGASANPSNTTKAREKVQSKSPTNFIQRCIGEGRDIHWRRK